MGGGGVGCMRAGLILHFQLRHRLNNSLSGKESSFYQLFGAFGPTPQFQNAVYVLSRTGSNIWCAIVGILDCPFNSNVNPPTAFQVFRLSHRPWQNLHTLFHKGMQMHLTALLTNFLNLHTPLKRAHRTNKKGHLKRALSTNSLGPLGQHPNSKMLPIIQDWANCTSDVRD